MSTDSTRTGEPSPWLAGEDHRAQAIQLLQPVQRSGGVCVNGTITAADPNAPINQLVGARLLSLQRSDGYWEQYAYQYNSGTKIMLTEKWSSWKNAAFGDKANARHTSIVLEEGSRTVIEKIGGQIVSNEYETLSVAPDGSRTLRTEQKTGSDTAALITEHAYFSDNAAEPFKGQNSIHPSPRWHADPLQLFRGSGCDQSFAHGRENYHRKRRGGCRSVRARRHRPDSRAHSRHPHRDAHQYL